MIDVTKFKPCGDKLLIKPDPVEEKTPKGIIKPTTDIDDLCVGTVISVSDGFYGQEGFWVDMRKLFKAGDRVLFQHGVAAPVQDQPEYSYIQMAGMLAREERKGEYNQFEKKPKEKEWNRVRTQVASKKDMVEIKTPEAPGC